MNQSYEARDAAGAEAASVLAEPRAGDCVFDDVETAIAAISRGEFVLVVDDEHRENEGDLIIAADAVTSEQLAFLVRHTSGIVCISLPGEVLDRLQLPLMVQDNRESHQTAFTVSLDCRHGTTTGVSAADRACTLRALADHTATAADFVRPGHVFPLRCRDGGVLARPGHTEAAHDLVKLAGRPPGGVLCELVNDDGTMARRPELFRFAAKHGLAIITITQLIEYRVRMQHRVDCERSGRIRETGIEGLAIWRA
nr:3,4-dihydroxy-2-butanone-4-phosphate synthase [Pseudomonas sp.]